MKTELKHHEFKAEWVSDEHGEGVMITQSDGWGDEAPTVILHPWQIRSICEHFQILESDEGAARQIAALKRRMVVLRDRLLDLHGHMLESPEHKRADLVTELTSVTALLDLAAEWCADFDDDRVCGPDQYARAKESSVSPHHVQADLI